VVDLLCWVYRYYSYAQKDTSLRTIAFLERCINYLEPTHIVIACDSPGKTFRHRLAEELLPPKEGYKATRRRADELLIKQIIETRQLCDEALGVRVVSKTGFEGDDLVASLVTQVAVPNNFATVILGTDKDLFQCIGERVRMWDGKPLGRCFTGPAEVEKKLGVPPSRVIDYLALVGDSADNVPGCYGVGPKKAAAIINAFDSLEEAIHHATIWHDDKPKGMIALAQNYEKVVISKRLVTLDHSVELGVSVEELRR
jgi:DNA polymerase-1